jgi:hypothetical protein
MENFGFIIVRNISQPIHQEYWKECVRCIRNFYSEKIIIIDDNSTLLMDYNKEKELFDNIEIVESEYKRAGEVLGYFYGWKHRPFKKFVVLHDSMFIQEKIDFNSYHQNILFLWHFDTYLGQTQQQWDSGSIDNNKNFIEHLKGDTIKIVKKLYLDKSSWLGCFGVSSFVTLEFVDLIFDKYDFLNVIKKINSRHDRETMERVFALLGFLEEIKLKDNPSILGNIINEYPYAGLRWYQYKQITNPKTKIIKIFSGR